MLGTLFGTALSKLGGAITALGGTALWTVAGSTPIEESIDEAKSIRQMQGKLDMGFHMVILGTAIYVVSR